MTTHRIHRTAAAGPGPQAGRAFVAGAVVGVLGGLVGLGGAEFRLPLLIGLFGFGALAAVILNKAMSLVVVASALLFRLHAVPLEALLPHWTIVVNLLAGSLLGAWWGASWATRAHPRLLFRVIAGLLVAVALVLLLHDALPQAAAPWVEGDAQRLAGVLAGLVIGVVASLLGVAGGELLIPVIVVLFGVDFKLAGSLSLAVSLPTMVAGFARYSRDGSFAVVRAQGGFMAAMAAGSLFGSAVGAALLGVVSAAVLLPALALILVASAAKVWQHQAGGRHAAL